MSTRFRQKKIRGLPIVLWAPVIFSLLPQRAQAATEIAGATLDVKVAAGAESCPDADALREQTSRLGTPPTTSGAPLRMGVEFLPNGSGYRVVVRTSGRTEGTRELTAEGPSCEPAAAATAVFLAVLLELLPPSDAPVARAEARVGAVEPAPARAEPASAPKARVPARLRYVSVGARLIAGYGLLGPTLSASFGGEARVRLGHAELELGGFAGPARSTDYPPGSVAVSLAAGHLGLCGYLDASVERVEFGVCATLFLGELFASGQGFHDDKHASSLWIAGAIDATLAIPLARHWALRAGMDLVVPFQQYTLEVDRVGVVFDSSPLALALAFGPEFRFR